MKSGASGGCLSSVPNLWPLEPNQYSIKILEAKPYLEDFNVLSPREIWGLVYELRAALTHQGGSQSSS